MVVHTPGCCLHIHREVFRKTSKEVPNFGLDCHQTSEEWWRKVSTLSYETSGKMQFFSVLLCTHLQVVTGTFAAVGIRDEGKS